MLSFGVFDHLDRRPGVAIGDVYEDRLRLIERYDSAGFHCWHLAEHHATPLGLAPSPAVFLAAAAQRTRRLRLGAMVFCLPMYEPLRLIEEICMLDHLSGGRLDIGIGRGVSPYEVAAFDIDPADAQAMYMEAFGIVMAGLRDGRVDHTGSHYTYRDVPLPLTPLQRPHPPLWYGVATPDGAGWPAGNGVNVISNAPCPVARSATDQYRKVWAATHGAAPLPRLGIARHLYIGATDAEAEARAADAWGLWFDSFEWLWQRNGTSPGVYARDFATARARDQLIAGAPDTVAAEIARQIEAAGVNYFVCRFAFGDLGFAESARSLARFVGQVMPTVRARVVRDDA